MSLYSSVCVHFHRSLPPSSLPISHFLPSTLPRSPVPPSAPPRLLPSSLLYPPRLPPFLPHFLSALPLSLPLPPSFPLSICNQALSVTVGLFVYQLQGHVFAKSEITEDETMWWSSFSLSLLCPFSLLISPPFPLSSSPPAHPLFARARTHTHEHTHSYILPSFSPPSSVCVH